MCESVRQKLGHTNIFRGPWFIIVSLLNDLVWIFSAQISQDMHYCDYLLTNLQVIAIMSIEYLYLGSITYATFPRYDHFWCSILSWDFWSIFFLYFYSMKSLEFIHIHILYKLNSMKTKIYLTPLCLWKWALLTELYRGGTQSYIHQVL